MILKPGHWLGRGSVLIDGMSLGKTVECDVRVEADDTGLVINADAQVQHEDGHTIEGLYAVGNCSAPTLPCYPGPGATLGPAMTFAYQAAKAITGYRD